MGRAGEFQKTNLGRRLSFANGRSTPDRADGLPHPVYGSNGIIGYANEANAEPGAIVIGRVGSYCGSLYLSKQRCWVTDNAMRAVALDDNDASFLYYLRGILSLNKWRAGSGQPLLNQDILSRIPAAVPEPSEQRAIASLLGALDEKIEQNRQMNETLEATARLFFKDWFVDFGPTRAKAEGRPPYLAPELWSLFPDALDDGDKPMGSEPVPLLEHAELISGGTPKTDVADYWGDEIAWASAKDVSQWTGLFLIDTERSITRRGLDESSTRMIPPLATVIVARGATTGRFCLFGRSIAMNQT